MYRIAQRRIVIPFILPALVLLGVFFLYPLVRTIGISLTEWDRTGSQGYTGAANYTYLFGDPEYRNALKNTFLFTFVGGCMLFPPAVAIAWSLSQRIRGERFFRFVTFAPVVLSTAVVALMWKFLYHPTLGLISPPLREIGLGALAKEWLGDPRTALPAVAFTTVWHGLGIWVVLLCAGFERLPSSVLEAARVDGASEWRVFYSVMLPLMRDLFRVLVVLWVVQSMQAFVFIFIMTAGGPFGSSEVVGTLMYRVAFELSDFGYAAAMGVVLVVTTLVLALVLNKVLKRDELEY